jgi:hypothetical protein
MWDLWYTKWTWEAGFHPQYFVSSLAFFILPLLHIYLSLKFLREWALDNWLDGLHVAANIKAAHLKIRISRDTSGYGHDGWNSIAFKGRDFSHRQHIQSGSGAYPASNRFWGYNIQIVKLTAHLHLRPTLRMRGAVRPLHHTSSWHGALWNTSSTKGNRTYIFNPGIAHFTELTFSNAGSFWSSRFAYRTHEKKRRTYMQESMMIWIIAHACFE